MAVRHLLCDPVAQLGEGLFVLDLRRLKGGASAIKRRIPSKTPGIYAWYRGFSLPSSDDASPEDFARSLILAATSAHCADREARLPPSLKVLLQPHQAMSEKKQRAVVAYCRSLSFRRLITQLLEMAILFQQPLYVGKAASLADRIEQHLSPRSPLRQRLDGAGISLDSTKLLFLTLDESEFSDLAVIDPADVLDDDIDTSSELPLELVMEEVFSRLFHPSFTLRYG